MESYLKNDIYGNMYEMNYKITWRTWVIIYKNTLRSCNIIKTFHNLLHSFMHHFMARLKHFHCWNFFINFLIFF